MKEIFNYICLAVLVLGLAACSKDDILPELPVTPEADGLMTIIANTESNVTRASLDGVDATGYKVVWNTGDEIRLYGDNARGIVYTLSQGAGTTKGEFTGRALSDGEYEAYYGNNNFIGGLQVYFPSSLIREATMRATVTIRNGVATIADFKNLCGILRLDIKGPAMTSVGKITIMTDQYISGPFTINANGCAVVGNDESQNFKKIELDSREYYHGSLSESKSEPFYIALPQGDYTGLKIWVENGRGEICYKALKAGKTLSIKRSQITPISLTCSEFVPSISGLARNSSDVSVRWFQLWEGGPKFAEYNVGGSPADIKAKLYNFNSIPSWGSNWRLPTKDEMKNGLAVKCDFVVKTVDGVKGKLYTGRGMYCVNSVFFPIAGTNNPVNTTFYPNEGNYWCSDSENQYGFARFTITDSSISGGHINSPGGGGLECSVRYARIN